MDPNAQNPAGGAPQGGDTGMGGGMPAGGTTPTEPTTTPTPTPTPEPTTPDAGTPVTPEPTTGGDTGAGQPAGDGTGMPGSQPQA